MDEVIMCPHCQASIIIEKLNCGIFRHGIYKKTGKQIGPHSSKEKCEALINKEAIWGCGKPFQIIIENKVMKAEGCDYI